MNTTELIVSGDLSPATTGLSNDLLARCVGLRMSHPEIFAVNQLDKLYEYPAQEIVLHVENGIALSQVAECLRLRHVLEELQDTDVETVDEFVKLIHFSSPNEIQDFSTDKIMYNGSGLTAQQYEDVLIQQISGGGSPIRYVQTQNMLEHSHDKVIETLLEGISDVFTKSDDPVKELLQKIKDELDGNVLFAYYLCINSPEKYLQFMEGVIDTHSLHYVSEDEYNDTPIHEEI